MSHIGCIVKGICMGKNGDNYPSEVDDPYLTKAFYEFVLLLLSVNRP